MNRKFDIRARVQSTTGLALLLFATGAAFEIVATSACTITGFSDLDSGVLPGEEDGVDGGSASGPTKPTGLDAGARPSADASDGGKTPNDASDSGVVSPPSSGGGSPDAGRAIDAGTGTVGTGAGNFPSRFSAPYVETWNDNNLANLANATGHKFYTLAFIINGQGTCNPAWNGDTSLTGNSYGSYIRGLRAVGGDVIVSFGGAAGTELGNACGTVSSLQAAYQKVISQFDLTWIDLDVESGAEADGASIDRRNKAIHNLQIANPSLRVSYTLAVDRTGLPSAQLSLLKNAQTNSARVDVVNIMAMDYGPCYSDMGQAAIDAATATQKQLATLGLAAKVGVTPMIGKNDVACEVFSIANANELVTFAQRTSYVGLLAFWATGADSNHAYVKAFHAFH